MNMDVISKRWLIASMVIYFIAITMQDDLQSLVTLLFALCMVWWAVNWRIAGKKEVLERKE